MDSAVQFEMDQKVHDVEEHFRRSLQSFQQKQASSSFLPVITNTSLKTSSLDHESHQIVIAENSTHEQSVHDSSSSSQNINFPNVLTKVPSNPATLAGPTSNQSPQVFLSLKTNYVGSDKARDKLANESEYKIPIPPPFYFCCILQKLVVHKYYLLPTKRTTRSFQMFKAWFQLHPTGYQL